MALFTPAGARMHLVPLSSQGLVDENMSPQQVKHPPFSAEEGGSEAKGGVGGRAGALQGIRE